MMNAVGKWLENNKTPGRKVGANIFLILSQIKGIVHNFFIFGQNSYFG